MFEKNSFLLKSIKFVIKSFLNIITKLFLVLKPKYWRNFVGDHFWLVLYLKILVFKV